MFKPRYSNTNKLLKNIKEIAVLISELNHKSFSETIVFNYENSAREMSSYSSTAIEGNPLPLTAVKKLLKEKPENLRDTEQEVVNYNKALEFLKEKSGEPLSNKLILDLHKILMHKLLAKQILGKYRKEPVLVNDPKIGKTVFWPPDHQDLDKLMQELVDFIEKNKQEIDFLILAGIFHKQFVVIHPFIDGNGRTTRLITKHLLANMGLDTFNLFSFENYYNNNVSNYIEKVAVKGDYYDSIETTDFTEWLEYFTDGIIDELIRVGEDLKKLSASPKTKLQKHHEKIINYIKKHGYIDDKTYSKLTDRAKATRSLDFKKLIELKIIQREGSGKNTFYKLIES